MKIADMEQLELQSKRKGRKVHSSLRIDMTPMVDLGFLLITFFILTTTMTENKAMKIIMPIDKNILTPTAESRVLTVLLAKNNKAYAYEGQFEDALSKGKIISTNYSESDGIGKLIRQKQRQLQNLNNANGKDDLVFLIKPTSGCSYKNVIDALDETAVNLVKKYMILDASAKERVFVEKF